ncbi:hypothetical protein CVT26_004656, partial [Gymnopilus dilepis]
MPPAKIPTSAEFVQDSDDSDEEFFPDEYANTDSAPPRRGAKAPENTTNPEDDNPVTSLLSDVSDARIGYFKVCFADDNSFGRGPTLKRHRLNRRVVSRESVLELRRALGGNTQDPKAPFTRIARYVPLYAVILIVDPSYVDMDAVVTDPGNLLTPGAFPQVKWTQRSVGGSVHLANGAHRRTVISELSRDHHRQWKEAHKQLLNIPPNDSRARGQKLQTIAELENEMEERSNWLAVAYDINKMTPEIEMFLTTNAHHYQESDTEQDRLHMALEYVFNKPSKDRLAVIQQARAPGGWPIPYPMPQRLKSVFDEVNLIDSLVEAYPYIKLWKGYELNPTSLSSWRGSPAPFMELLLDQATLTLNFLSANLNLRAAYPSVNPARTEQLRLELLRDPPVPVPAILDEQFFIIATNAYKEHLMPLRELFAVAKSQDEDLNKWNDAYQTYANDLLPKLRQ